MRKPQCFYDDFTELASKLSVGLTSAALLLGFNLRKHLHSTICKRPVETDPTGDSYSIQGRGRQRQRPGSFDRQNGRIAVGRATNEGKALFCLPAVLYRRNPPVTNLVTTGPNLEQVPNHSKSAKTSHRWHHGLATCLLPTLVHSCRDGGR